MKNPQMVVNKWAANLAAAGPAIREAVQAVTSSPMEKAAARQEAWVAGVQRAAASGKYQRRLRQVSLQMWQQAMIDKGIPRIAEGANKAKQKFMDFMVRWLQYEEGLKALLAGMPRGGLEQNIQRAVETIRYNARFVDQGGGGALLQF